MLETDRLMSLRILAAVLSVAALGGCDGPAATDAAPAQPASSGSDYALPSFVGKVWVSTTPGMARGSIKVFLPNKTVLIDSCFEGFRIEKWGVISDDVIRWVEDSIPIEARYEQPTAESLRLTISGLSRVETYVSASAPYVCPETPR